MKFTLKKIDEELVLQLVLRIDVIKEEPNMAREACNYKNQNTITDKFKTLSDVEIDRSKRIEPCKTKSG